MNSRFFEQVEIVFWDATIPVMTRIRKVQNSLLSRNTTQTAVDDTLIPERLMTKIIFWSVVGLAFGLFLGMLGAVVV
jgi:hypothetical protein